jgi:serine/threonine-protein kinase
MNRVEEMSWTPCPESGRNRVLALDGRALGAPAVTMDPSPQPASHESAARGRALTRGDWRRLNLLLAQALDVEPERRSDWLQTLPESDRELVPVLADLLARAESTEAGRLSTRTGAGALREAAAAAAAHPPSEEQPGTQVGPYRLLRELGVGGMGSVWLAERTDGSYQRQVALKLPRAEWTDRGLAERMARERTVLASLNHPNIAQMYEAGWASDGRPYLALEYVDGAPIDAWCKNHSLTTAARVRLFVDVVRAVAFAHAKLVIHRDLKPSNVLVTTDGRVKLLDFGIAKLLTAEAATVDETALTQLSGRALTLNYAAPEQITGQPVSTAADTYSLGVMLFELLTGSRPYRPTRDSRGALEEAIVSTDPSLPSSSAEDKAAARALRGDLDAIVLKALRKQPEQRYETAAAFADDLQRWLDQRPVRAQRSSSWYRARRFVGRHRSRFVAGTVTTAALLATGGIALWQSWNASEDAARADTVRAFVLSIIAQADPAASRETRDADLTLLTTAESRLARELGTHPALALELRLAIARAFRNRGEFERARATLRAAIDEARKTLPPDDLNLMRVWVRLADWQLIDDNQVMRELDATIDRTRLLGRRGAQILVEGLTARAALRQYRLSRLEEGQADVRAAYEVAVRHFGPGDPIALRVALEMSERRFRVSESLPVIESSYRAANANPGLGLAHPDRLRIQSVYGMLLCVSGRGREGLELLRASASIARKHHGGSLPTEYTLAALRVGLVVTGDARGSMAAAKEALELASAREPPGALNRGMRSNMVVFSAIAARRIDEALPLVREADVLAMRREGDRPDVASVLVNQHKIWVMNLAGDTVGAEDLAERTIALAEAQGIRPFVRSIRLAWSYALRKNGKALEAERLLADLPDPRLGDFDEDEDFLSESAAVRLAAGDAQAALDLSDHALRAFQRIRLQIDPALSDLHVTRGQALLALKRPAEARDAFQIADDFWRVYEADSHWSAEASYWLARALIETGDTATGKPMLKAAQARLAKSPMPLHRRLAAETAAR